MTNHNTGKQTIIEVALDDLLYYGERYTDFSTLLEDKITLLGLEPPDNEVLVESFGFEAVTGGRHVTLWVIYDVITDDQLWQLTPKGRVMFTLMEETNMSTAEASRVVDSLVSSGVVVES